MFLSPGRIEGRERLGEAPEVHAPPCRHVVAVHHRLQEPEPRHFVDDEQHVPAKIGPLRDGVRDRDPQPKPPLDVIEELLRRDHEEVDVAGGKIVRIESRGGRVAGHFGVAEKGELVGDRREVRPALLLADPLLSLDREVRQAAANRGDWSTCWANADCWAAPIESS